MVNTFLAANSTQGFYCIFDEMTKRTDHSIFLIKGGPGTGKSSLMKKIAHAAMEKGMEVEQMHCSSDPDSLDGVWVKEKKLILLDATSPHLTDPRFPGAVEQILHLGEYWNTDKLRARREEIVSLTTRISEIFKNIYRLLGAAGQVQKISESVIKKAFREQKAVAALTKLFSHRALLPLQKTGTVERRFISALSCKGNILYEDILQHCQEVVLIEDSHDCAHLITEIADRMAEDMGYDRIQLLSPLHPERIDHLILPERSFAIISQNARLQLQSELPVIKVLPLKKFLDSEIVSANKNKLAFVKKMCKALFDEVSSLLTSEKALHDELEQYYIDAMDFDRLNELTEQLIKHLL